MTEVWAQAALWLGLALGATLMSIWLRIATALSEIVVGIIAQLVIGVILGAGTLGADESWINFLSGAGAIVLTFLAGAEIDPFTFRTVVFVAAGILVFAIIPWLTPRFFRRHGGRPSEPEAKYLLLILFGMGALAAWAESEAVLPAYIIGIVLAGTVGKDHALIRRLRTLTFGLLTPFYFIRAGSFVSVPALIAAPGAFLVLLLAKIATKVIGVYPVTRIYRSPNREAMYTTLLMSTGLTFGSISALFGLTHHVIDQAQYSLLVLAVIASAVMPTLIANAFFLPHHLLRAPADTAAEPQHQLLAPRIGQSGQGARK